MKKAVLMLAAICTFAVGLFGMPLSALADVSPGAATDSRSGDFVSHNWAGYTASDTGHSYTGVGATWTIPTANSTGYAADAAWVGIGGVFTSDLIQAGTQAVSDTSGNFAYRAWYEILPDVPVTIPISVKPGDIITVSITQQASNQWLIMFQDVTTKQAYQTSVNYTSTLASAEWIEEMPLGAASGRFVPLDNFDSIQFSDAWAIRDNIKDSVLQANGLPMTMYDQSNQALAKPSALGADGGSFSVDRTAVVSSAQVQFNQGQGDRRPAAQNSNGEYGGKRYRIGVSRGWQRGVHIVLQNGEYTEFQSSNGSGFTQVIRIQSK